MLWKEIQYLIEKEFRLELRQKYALNSILLYVISTIFISYLSFRVVDHPATWNALFWIILLFAAVNALSKSFSLESKGNILYQYTLVSPQAVILSKTIYNILLLLLLSLVCYTFYSIFIGNLVQDQFIFIAALILGSIGFSSILTMIAAIATKTNNNFALMAILSFPLMIPLLITLIQVSKNAVDGLAPSVSYDYLLVLVFLDLIVILLGYLLFPYLWRD